MVDIFNDNYNNSNNNSNTKNNFNNFNNKNISSNNDNTDEPKQHWANIVKRMTDNTYILKIAYNGNNEGFQSHPEKKNNVCDIIVRALINCGYMEYYEKPVLLRGGRTDDGVLALGNFIIVNLIKEPILSHIYSKLKNKGVWVLGYAKINNLPKIEYRHYRYILPNEGQNLNLMKMCAEKLTGEHSFHNLSKRDNTKNKSMIRKIYNIEIEENPFFFTIDIYGKNFLWNMVRRIITVMSKVSLGEKSLNWVDNLLNPNYNEGVAPAPPNGLILVNVKTNIQYKYSDYVIRQFKNELKEEYRKNITNSGVSLNMINLLKK